MTDTQDPSRSRRWPAPVGLAVLAVALFFCRLGDDLPLRSHEALLAETARHMVLDRPAQLADGSRPSPWLVPNWNGGPRLRKTPLPYWTAAGLAVLTGRVDEWSTRLPSALAALGTVLILIAILRRWCDRPTALIGGAALASTIGFLIVARMAVADMQMTLLVSASLAAVWMGVESGGPRRFGWFVLAGAAAGFSMLAKGPAPLLVLPAPCLVAAWTIRARLRRPCSPEQTDTAEAERARSLGGAGAAVLVFLLITLPWPIYIYFRVPGAVAIWQAESVDRALGEFGHQESPLFYLVRLPLLLAPWGLFFLIGLVLATVRACRSAAQRPWLLFVGAWLVGPLVAFSLAAGKQDHYILPILPAAAVYTALAMHRLFAPDSSWSRHVGRWIMIVLGILILLGGLPGPAAWILERIQPGILERRGIPPWLATADILVPVAVLGGVGMVEGVAVIVLGARRRLLGALAVQLAAFAVAFLIAWTTLLGPMDRATVAADFARRAQQAVPPGSRLFAFTGINNTMLFYLDRPLPVVGDMEGLREEIDRGTTFFLICEDKSDGKTVAPLRDLRGMVEVLHVTNRFRPDESLWLFESAGTPSAPPEGTRQKEQP